jgi:hypothetical protein
MSQENAIREVRRFLGRAEPEVLSISGRWGVGKTFVWDNEIRSAGAGSALQRYAYVSAFGLRSIEALKTSIVQSTVRLDAPGLEPTVDSFIENFASVDGLKNAGEQGLRKGLDMISKLASAVPYAGKAADLLSPGAALLIRNQIVCIDDLERAGTGLEVTDILGLASFLRERRGCKIVLLLNEEGLGEQRDVYRSYLEKAVDQAIRYEPTPEESALAALPGASAAEQALRAKTMALGIINIRVIRRIYRFFQHMEPLLSGLNAGVGDRVIQSLALLGWAVFEPAHAPSLAAIRKLDRYVSLSQSKERTARELQDDAALSAYGFREFVDLDELILKGLQAGSFDEPRLRDRLRELDARLNQDAARRGIDAPWAMLDADYEEDLDGFVNALVSSVETYAADMWPADVTAVLATLRELGQDEHIPRLVDLYMTAQANRPREFFEISRYSSMRELDPALVDVFRERLIDVPLDRDPAEILLRIARSRSWNPEDTAFLASMPEHVYADLVKNNGGNEGQAIIATALQFGNYQDASAEYQTIAGMMKSALRALATEGPLNAMRVRRYISDADLPAEGDKPVT